jgi:hypothetical protein
MSGLDMFAWIVLVILVASLGAKRMEMLFGPKTDRDWHHYPSTALTVALAGRAKSRLIFGCTRTRRDERDSRMPRKGITGHDEWVVTEALATAIIALEQLPAKHQPRTHMDEIRKLLAAGCQPGTLSLHLAQAKCRLFPDLDPLTIYREYGLGDGQG